MPRLILKHFNGAEFSDLKQYSSDSSNTSSTTFWVLVLVESSILCSYFKLLKYCLSAVKLDWYSEVSSLIVLSESASSSSSDEYGMLKFESLSLSVSSLSPSLSSPLKSSPFSPSQSPPSSPSSLLAITFCLNKRTYALPWSEITPIIMFISKV